LLRVPYTFNSKCIGEGIGDAEVKIVQSWDSSQILSEIDNLLIEFQTYLIDKSLKAQVKEEKTVKNRYYSCDSADIYNTTIPYIEKLLNVALEDYRKSAISLILAPYFINVQKLTDADSFSRTKEWVLKCNLAKKLEPSINYDDLINRAIERAKDTGIRPLKFEETLQYKNRELYNMFR
jgi:hypothetical protein